MVGFLVFRLNFSAIFANSKSLAHFFNAGNGKFFASHITLAKVDFTQGCLANKLISKREIFIVHAICTGNIMVFIYINQKLLAVEDVIAVITFIVNQALGIIHIGVNHLNFQHRSDLASISPSGTSTLWTRRCTFPGFFNLCVRTVWTKPPSCGLCSRQIDLIYR